MEYYINQYLSANACNQQSGLALRVFIVYTFTCLSRGITVGCSTSRSTSGGGGGPISAWRVLLGMLQRCGPVWAGLMAECVPLLLASGVRSVADTMLSC
jgi:hypothetical protein